MSLLNPYRKSFDDYLIAKYDNLWETGSEPYFEYMIGWQTALENWKTSHKVMF